MTWKLLKTLQHTSIQYYLSLSVLMIVEPYKIIDCGNYPCYRSYIQASTITLRFTMVLNIFRDPGYECYTPTTDDVPGEDVTRLQKYAVST